MTYYTNTLADQTDESKLTKFAFALLQYSR